MADKKFIGQTPVPQQPDGVEPESFSPGRVISARGLMSEAALTFSQILDLQALAQTSEDYEHLVTVSSYALRDLGRRMDYAQEALGGTRGGWFDEEAGDE